MGWDRSRIWTCLVLASAGFPAPACSAEGPALPKGMTMHRIQAGEPDETGWYSARSTEGHFDVRLPVPFNDFSIRSKGEGGKEVDSFAIGSKSAEGLKFSATEMSARKANVDDREAQEAFLRGFREDKSSKMSGERRFEVEGHPALEFKIKNRRSSAVIRQILLPDRIFLLIVESPPGQDALAEELAGPFLDSFKIRGLP